MTRIIQYQHLVGFRKYKLALVGNLSVGNVEFSNKGRTIKQMFENIRSKIEFPWTILNKTSLDPLRYFTNSEPLF